MDYKMQSVILVCQILTGFLSGRFFLCYFRKIKTGKLDFYVGDRFRQDSSEPKFGGGAIAFTLILGLAIGIAMRGYAGSSFNYSIPLVTVGVMTVLCMCIIGFYQDYMKETKRGIGIKGRYIVAGEYILCAGFLLIKQLMGYGQSTVLLPFRLGYINFGKLYIPLMALFMTLVINCVKIHDCQGGDVSRSVQGLEVLDCMIYALGIGAGAAVVGRENEGILFAVCTAGACFGFLIWNISPSKMYPGESGALLLGGLLAVMTEMSGLPFVFITSGMAFIIDGVCALIQFAVYKTKKKLVFRGLTLHEHLKMNNCSDYKVMGIYGIISLLGAALTVWFFIYSGHIILN